MGGDSTILFTEVGSAQLFLIAYMLGIFLYIIRNIYLDGQQALIIWREAPHIKCETAAEAVSRGCQEYAPYYLWSSLFWPIIMLGHIVPTVIIYLNPPSIPVCSPISSPITSPISSPITV